MPLTAGSRLGPYEVTSQIGKGGMGEVYQATDTKLDRDVALKILPEDFASDPDRLARFQREAKVLASLNHPNIAAIYGLEDSGETHALVLELVPGPTLQDRISQGPIPLDEALPIAKQIADALEAAHEQGIIHRDLKPANIKVTPDGVVKVLDFGLAKALDVGVNGARGEAPADSPTMSMTAAATKMGMIMGTAAYMSPEQARGKTVSRQTDIWAFGVVVFESEDVSLTLADVMRAEPEWDVLPEAVPPRVRTVIRRCLEKETKHRIRDIGDVGLAMDGAFETTGESPPDARGARHSVWQRPATIGITALVALVVGGLGVWALTHPAPSRVARFPVPLAVDQAFRFDRHPLVAISPDGSQVVYEANGGLWLRPIDQLQATQVRGTASGSEARAARGPFFSADGQSVGFWTSALGADPGGGEGELKKVSLSGGAPVTLANVRATALGASWGIDDMVVYAQPDGIWQVPGAGGTPELLVPVDEGKHLHGPQMLPGGEWVLFSQKELERGWNDGEIVAESVSTGERTLLIQGGRDGRYLSTGHLVYVRDNVLLAVGFDAGSRQVAGEPIALAEGVAQAGSGFGAAQFAVSAAGSLVYVPGSARSSDVTMTWVSRQGAEKKVSAPSRAYGRPRVSPDGTRIAVDIVDGDNRDIWVWDLARETLTQLTFDDAADNYPLWTPDSGRVAFTSEREGGGLFWKAADGSGQVERLKDGLARPYAWAPDGRLIFEEALNLGVLMMEGDRTHEMLFDAGFSGGEPALSPDGRWLAFYRELGNDLTATIDVVPFPNVEDGRWSVSQGSGPIIVQPVWSPDGRELFYRSDTDLMVAPIEAEPSFSIGTPRPLFSLSDYKSGLTAEEARLWDLAPAGDRFLLLSPAATQSTGNQPFNGLIYVDNWFHELLERVPVP